MADKRIIILDKVAGAGTKFNVLYWLTVPTDRQPYYANQQANFVSQWPGIDPTETAKFKAGELIEVADTYSRQSGGMAVAMTDLEENWQKLQDQFNNDTRLQRYGSTWDGTAWDVKNFT